MTDEAQMADDGAHAPRRMPTQQRSRERLERILSAAVEAIAARGSDQMTMSEVARLAGISIGSLYQYFPEKSAIIRALAERYNAENRRCIAEALAGVHDSASLESAYLGLLDQYYEIVLAEPAMRDIWSGMQADKQLVELELAESRAAGGLLADAMRRVFPDADPVKVATAAFLIWQLGEATMRLALSHDRTEGAALVDAFKRMSLREVMAP
jgi:AcrR family transcriptional regulator